MSVNGTGKKAKTLLSPRVIFAQHDPMYVSQSALVVVVGRLDLHANAQATKLVDFRWRRTITTRADGSGRAASVASFNGNKNIYLNRKKTKCQILT